tara:strand:+ start:354 stop:758 length:405 start_codon:yes stop_codon:yes gene_type:complete
MPSKRKARTRKRIITALSKSDQPLSAAQLAKKMKNHTKSISRLCVYLYNIGELDRELIRSVGDSGRFYYSLKLQTSPNSTGLLSGSFQSRTSNAEPFTTQESLLSTHLDRVENCSTDLIGWIQTHSSQDITGGE